VIAGRGAAPPGSPLNVPPVLASNFVLGTFDCYPTTGQQQQRCVEPKSTVSAPLLRSRVDCVETRRDTETGGT
jgi:hypothetical protein